MVRVREKINSRSKGKASDDSDEDYMAEEDFFDDVDESDEYCASFDGDMLEEDFEEKRKVKNVDRWEAELGCSKRRNGFKISRKRKRVSYNEAIDDEDGTCDLDGDKLEEDLDDFEKDQEVKKVDTSKAKWFYSNKRNFGCKIAQRRKRVSYNEAMYDEEGDYDLNDEENDDEFVANTEDDEEEDCDDEFVADTEDDEEEDCDDEDDHEFMPEEIDSLGEEEDLKMKKKMKKNKVGRRALRKNDSVITRKRKRNSNVLRKPCNRKGRTMSNMIRKVKNCDEDGFFTKKAPIMREKIKRMPGRRKKRLLVQSDSDFESSGLSDNDFTVSEEDSEQGIEAGKLTSSLRSSSSNKIENDINLNQQIKTPLRKGKDKIEDVKKVCGICLSEKGKRAIRGTLNCCNHYFCFRCILEWSKRESRCPLCKQRFMTISKHGRDSVIKVPERNQIYQPSDEELTGYLDPYEHVICTECHGGWDDNLMLLCDICDSPAHTYCVGLGQDVPEGNWYCDGCRPAALASLNSPPQVHLPDQTTTTTNNIPHRSSPFENNEHGLNRNTIMPSPFLPFSQEIGATTLSGRRYIQSHIRSFLTSNRTTQVNGRNDEVLAANLGSNNPGFQVDQGLVTAYQLTDLYREGVQENSSVFQNGLVLPALPSNIRRNVVQEHGHSRNGINLMSGHDQLHQCSNRVSIDSARNFSSFALEEANQLYIEKDQVQYIVERYLKSISSNLGLDVDTCDDITSKSTHAILGACGLHHQTGEVYSLRQHPPPNCFHVERMINRQTGLMIRYCSSCFESLLKHVVKTTLNEKLPFFLRVKV